MSGFGVPGGASDLIQSRTGLGLGRDSLGREVDLLSG
jgi:hypothetical protein